MTTDQDQADVLVLKAVEQVEERISQRESRRFRSLYALVGIVSFVGIGVIAQLVDFYATKAVDSRIERSKQEYESAKAFAQLLALATKLDISTSFSHTDRDAVMRLLAVAKTNKQLRGEPVFDALLEKIVDSFTSSNNAWFVNTIFDDYKEECLRVPGLVETLLQHYARTVIGRAEISSDDAKKEIARFQSIANVAPSFALAGSTAFFSALIEHKVASEKTSPALQRTLKSYSALSDEEARDFRRFMRQFRDPMRLARRLRPESIRISELTQSFENMYAPQIESILQKAAHTPDEDDEDET